MVKLLLKNANIIDGSGTEPYRGDILVHKDSIVAIGTIPNRIRATVIDCQGAYVAPGFIDAASTADRHFTLFKFPHQDHAIEGGVTSAIGGGDGISLAPFLYGARKAFQHHPGARGVPIDWHTTAEFLKTIDRIKPALNFGTMIGYDLFRSEPLAVRKALLMHALQEGSLGISLGMQPRSLADERMLDEVLSEHRGTVLAMPHPPDAVTEKQMMQRLVKRSRDYNTRVVFTRAVPAFCSEAEYERILLQMKTWEAHEFFVMVSPGEHVATPAIRLLPDWLRDELPRTILEKITDPWLAPKIAKELPTFDPKSLTIAYVPHAESALAGLTLAQIMTQRGIRDPKIAFMELLTITNLHVSIRLPHPNMLAMKQIMQYPHILLGSHEPGAYPAHWRDLEFKNGFFAALVAYEEQGTMPLVRYVNTATGRIADTYHIKDRGRIAENMKADLIVFKNKELRSVIVNGTVVYEHGALRPARPGQSLRPRFL